MWSTTALAQGRIHTCITHGKFATVIQVAWVCHRLVHKGVFNARGTHPSGHGVYPCDAPLCGPLMEASPTCCCTCNKAMHPPDGSTIAAPLAAPHLVEWNASKGASTIVPKPTCCRVATGRLRALGEGIGTGHSPVPYGAYGP